MVAATRTRPRHCRNAASSGERWRARTVGDSTDQGDRALRCRDGIGDGNGNRLRQDGYCCRDKTGQRAKCCDDRTSNLVMVTMAIGVISIVRVMADQSRQDAPFETVVVVMVCRCQRFAEIEGEMNRHQSIEGERQYASQRRPANTASLARSYQKHLLARLRTIVEQLPRSVNKLPSHATARARCWNTAPIMWWTRRAGLCGIRPRQAHWHPCRRRFAPCWQTWLYLAQI
jgi:hypothetical protein